MGGIRYLFISRADKVHKIRIPVNNQYPAVKELQDELVLEVILNYETQNRKPYRLVNVTFDRLQLNEEGRYIYTEEEQKERFYNFKLFAFNTPESLSEREGPIYLPRAIAIPTEREKETLIKYIEKEMPLMYQSGLQAIDDAIYKNQEIYDNLIYLVKEAAKLKKQREKERPTI